MKKFVFTFSAVISLMLFMNDITYAEELTEEALKAMSDEQLETSLETASGNSSVYSIFSGIGSLFERILSLLFFALIPAFLFFRKYVKKILKGIAISLVAGMIILGLQSIAEPEDVKVIKAEINRRDEIKKQQEQEVAQATKEKERQDREQQIAGLSEEYKKLYETKFAEYNKDNKDEERASIKALQEVLEKKAADEERAKNLAKAEAEKQAQAAKEEQEKIDKAKAKLAELEKAGAIKYQDLGNGTYNVTITRRASLKKYLDNNDFDKLANYAIQDEHERNVISTSNQCMILVQTVKDAGIKVNYFTINLTGDVEDSEGYRSVGNIVECEIDGNKSFTRDDPYSFHNNCNRFWTINGL